MSLTDGHGRLRSERRSDAATGPQPGSSQSEVNSLLISHPERLWPVNYKPNETLVVNFRETHKRCPRSLHAEGAVRVVIVEAKDS